MARHAFKVVPIVLMLNIFNAHALTDVQVDHEKYSLLNGSTPEIEAYFESKNGTDALRLRSPDGYRIIAEPKVQSKLSSLKSNYKISGYAMIHNGECARFVQYITDSGYTGGWRRGNKVTGYWDGNALVGKTIATFGSDGKYQNAYGSSHVAIVLAAWRSSPGSGPIDSAWVLDSNYVKGAGNGVIGRHRIDTKGSTITSNLNNYYIVQH